MDSYRISPVPLLFLALLHSLFLDAASFSSKVYIVYMGERKFDEPELVQDSHHEILAELLGSKETAKESILYSYKHGFSGFAAELTELQAKSIADFPGVVRVVPNRILSLHTTRSWDFLQVNPHLANGVLTKSRSGAGSILGIMDTGIWPESPSFNDDGMSKVPSRWRGICQAGEKFNRSHCNRKIIGARWYNKGYEAEFGKLNTTNEVEYLSPRDADGHGTHTSSTAAGVSVENANFQGLARGVARGGAASAHLAVYKVCWATGGCSSADLLAAFDDAIFDNVDVISASIGSSPPLPSYVEDVISIGTFHAMARGIATICSAGNSGPEPQTVINTAPWIITVAASTIDRAFPVRIKLGNNVTLMGQALYTAMNTSKSYPIVFGQDIAASGVDENKASGCGHGSLNATLARGKLVLCFQSRYQRSAIVAATTVIDCRGAGIIFAQTPTKDVALSWGFLYVQIDYSIGTSLLAYMEATKNPVIKFSLPKTTLGRQISPEIAYFSSRGPNSLSPSVLKPDVAAPGVNILASWSPASPDFLSGGHSQQSPASFKIESGTSMSCPHISGIVAMLIALHPSWSPAAIKSALVTTASINDEYGQRIVAEGAPHKIADPFDYGGGHVDPNKAMDPGLVFDMKTADYVQFLCSMGYNDSAVSSMAKTRTRCSGSSKYLLNLNLPSIAIPKLKTSRAVFREVTNVGLKDSIYVARVEAPAGVSVRVEPSILSFSSSVEKLKFKVTFCPLLRVQGRYSFGNLIWEDGLHAVRIPIAVKTVIDDFYAET